MGSMQTSWHIHKLQAVKDMPNKISEYQKTDKVSKKLNQYSFVVSICTVLSVLSVWHARPWTPESSAGATCSTCLL